MDIAYSNALFITVNGTVLLIIMIFVLHQPKLFYGYLFVSVNLDMEQKEIKPEVPAVTTQNNTALEMELTINLTDVNEIPTLSATGNQTLCATTTTQTIALAGISAGPETGQTTTLSVSSSNSSLY